MMPMLYGTHRQTCSKPFQIGLQSLLMKGLFNYRVLYHTQTRYGSEDPKASLAGNFSARALQNLIQKKGLDSSMRLFFSSSIAAIAAASADWPHPIAWVLAPRAGCPLI